MVNKAGIQDSQEMLRNFWAGNKKEVNQDRPETYNQDLIEEFCYVVQEEASQKLIKFIPERYLLKLDIGSRSGFFGNLFREEVWES